jgi:hypothetical protein
MPKPGHTVRLRVPLLVRLDDSKSPTAAGLGIITNCPAREITISLGGALPEP